jgi:hypothetical protein
MGILLMPYSLNARNAILHVLSAMEVYLINASSAMQAFLSLVILVLKDARTLITRIQMIINARVVIKVVKNVILEMKLIASIV